MGATCSASQIEPAAMARNVTRYPAPILVSRRNEEIARSRDEGPALAGYPGRAGGNPEELTAARGRRPRADG